MGTQAPRGAEGWASICARSRELIGRASKTAYFVNCASLLRAECGDEGGRYEGGGAHAVPGFKQADCAFWRSLEG